MRYMDFGWNNNVAGGELINGNSPNAVGSVHKIYYKDGSEWTVQLLELSGNLSRF